MSTFRTNVYDYSFLKISVNDCLEKLIRTFLILDISKLIRREIRSSIRTSSTSIEHHCFDCNSKILIDISDNLINNQRIKYQSFLCDEHKKIKIESTSLSFFRYENLFYKKLQEIYRSNEELWNKYEDF